MSYKVIIKNRARDREWTEYWIPPYPVRDYVWRVQYGHQVKSLANELTLTIL